jgi:hypothetical protein
MGGKRLKFPKRGKYVPPTQEIAVEEKKVSEDEHKARIASLKALGLIKEE